MPVEKRHITDEELVVELVRNQVLLKVAIVLRRQAAKAQTIEALKAIGDFYDELMQELGYAKKTEEKS